MLVFVLFKQVVAGSTILCTMNQGYWYIFLEYNCYMVLYQTKTVSFEGKHRYTTSLWPTCKRDNNKFSIKVSELIIVMKNLRRWLLAEGFLCLSLSQSLVIGFSRLFCISARKYHSNTKEVILWLNLHFMYNYMPKLKLCF